MAGKRVAQSRAACPGGSIDQQRFVVDPLYFALCVVIGVSALRGNHDAWFRGLCDLAFRAGDGPSRRSRSVRNRVNDFAVGQRNRIAPVDRRHDLGLQAGKRER